VIAFDHYDRLAKLVQAAYISCTKKLDGSKMITILVPEAKR
jgi:hypothetical protein